MYGRTFMQCASSKSLGIYFNGYFSLASGRDLLRIRSSRTPSAGLDTLNLEFSRTFVLYDKIMDNLIAFKSRFKGKIWF